MSRAARLGDPVAHSHALAGFLAGAVVGLVAATEAAAVVGAVVGAVALEVGTAGLATPLVVGVAATALELGVGGYVGAKLMGAAEETGEALGSQSLGPTSGKVSQGSADVRVNSRPAARALDAETCDAGKVAQGSRLVRINGLPAARVGDKTSCGGQISEGSANVRIGGPPDTRAGVQSEVPEWVRWATLVASLLPALGQAARGLGPALAEVEATGFGRALQTGVKALGRAMEERGGGGVKPSLAAPPPAATGESAADRAAANLRSARTAGEIESARNDLKGLDYGERQQVLSDFSKSMDVSTPANSAVFYSGGRTMPTGVPGQVEYVRARSYAEASAAANGRTTLEQTAGGNTLDKVDIFRPDDPLLTRVDGSDIWATASGRYADAATGDVHAYLDNPYPESIYNRVERPSLDQGVSTGRVTSINEFDIDEMHERMRR
ncbi:MAG: PAAR domain-containing protein [Caulobacteraceae bacterium]|nr:PAAR domain-containing protein [Caulobacter sp.]